MDITRLASIRAKYRTAVAETQRRVKQKEIGPASAAIDRSKALKELQKAFEALPGIVRSDPQVIDLAKGIERDRRNNAWLFLKLHEHKNLAYELRQLAHCQEIRIITPSRQAKPELSQKELAILKSALNARFQALRLLRRKNLMVEVAYELSYIAKTMFFLRTCSQRFKTDNIMNKLVALRTEAAFLFEQQKSYRDAYYEYRFLAGYYLEIANRCPIFYHRVISVGTKAVGLAEQTGKKRTLSPVVLTMISRAYMKLAKMESGEKQAELVDLSAKYECLSYELGNPLQTDEPGTKS